MTGIPRDSEWFVAFLFTHGCPTQAGRRVLEKLQTVGEFKGTLRADLDFNVIGLGLLKQGVALRILPPLRAHGFLQVSALYLGLECGLTDDQTR